MVFFFNRKSNKGGGDGKKKPLGKKTLNLYLGKLLMVIKKPKYLTNFRKVDEGDKIKKLKSETICWAK